MSDSFKCWSEKFKEARKATGDIKTVIDLWQSRVPGDWKGRRWKKSIGYRKKSHDGQQHGEQRIESLMLGGEGEIRRLKLVDAGGKEYPIQTLYQNFALSTQSKGQVIADVMGVVQCRGCWHPLLVEVKEKHGNPWYAAVECLQQIKLARAFEVNIREFTERVSVTPSKGAWGLVVAPKQYFSGNRNREIFKTCKILLDELKRTEARIAFASADELVEGRVQILDSNWE